jgi:hypothetical protein
LNLRNSLLQSSAQWNEGSSHEDRLWENNP